MGRSGIVAGEACVERGAIHVGGHQPQREGHRQHDALAERTIRGNEDGTLREPGVLLDLRRVLVREFQAIHLECRRADGIRRACRKSGAAARTIERPGARIAITAIISGSWMVRHR